MQRRPLLIAAVAVAAVVAGLGCRSAPAGDRADPPRAEPASGRLLRVLFIGNSYTYYNNLPAVFTAVARAGGHAVEAEMIAPGGQTLGQHWDNEATRRAVRDGRWDVVVLQEQSTLGVMQFPDGVPQVTTDEVFVPRARAWIAEIRAAGARPVLYATWARARRPQDQAALDAAYAKAAGTDAVVAPVGDAWAAYPERASLYHDDGSHPRAAGTYLAACVLYATIVPGASLERSPTTITGDAVDLTIEAVVPGRTATLVELPAATATALQRAAAIAVGETRSP